MDDERITVVRDGRFYHTDRDTVDVLTAVQKWDLGADRHAAQENFERGLRTDRIAAGPVRAQGHTVDHIMALASTDSTRPHLACVPAHRARGTGHGQGSSSQC